MKLMFQINSNIVRADSRFNRSLREAITKTEEIIKAETDPWSNPSWAWVTWWCFLHKTLEDVEDENDARRAVFREKARKRTIRCTCSVRMAMTGPHLPGCPRGEVDGRGCYDTMSDVPNDMLNAEDYEKRHGCPPPTCPECGCGVYEAHGNGCRVCALRAKLEMPR